MSNGLRACVIGWPVEHSRSPLIHTHWLETYRIDGRYDKRAVPPDGLADALEALLAEGYVGCNVTLPHKEDALALADEADVLASAIGAANTLWFQKGKIFATNTDAYGFITHLQLSAPRWRAADRPSVVLGAGGAARAVVKALIDAGAKEVRLVNRTRQRAEALAHDLGGAVAIEAWARREAALADCGLVVNTTMLGMAGAPALEIALEAMARDAVVADIVYTPLETPLLARARAGGLTAVDGLGMLLHQAVPGFEKWFGIRPQVDAVLRDLIVADLEPEPC